MEKMKNEVIRSFLDNNLDALKEAAHKRNIVIGLKETIKKIKQKKIEMIYIADCEYKSKFMRILKTYVDAYLDKKIEPIVISDYTILRDIVLCKVPSDITNLNYMKKGMEIKEKGPKCYCAAVLKT